MFPKEFKALEIKLISCPYFKDKAISKKSQEESSQYENLKNRRTWVGALALLCTRFHCSKRN